MSMLTAQCDGLRKLADEVERLRANNVDWLQKDSVTLLDASAAMREAADTILSLRNTAQGLALTDAAGACGSTETETVVCAVHVMECDACGRTYEHVNGDYGYCPHCRVRRI